MKLDPFLDECGILRQKGRIENANLAYEIKHPIIIPPGHLSKLIVRFQHIFMKHCGVDSLIENLRNEYCIIKCRRVVKRVRKECIRCQRFDARHCRQRAAPLPESRVRPTAPFANCGVDYAGPLYCKDQSDKKFYILLITCAVTRAVHLELTESQNLSDFVLAFRRFVSRRGLPSHVYSDNAKTFLHAHKELINVYGPNTPKWSFSSPRSPWHGGWWERLVRSVKSALKKTLGLNYVDRIELETLLFEIESTINSRPLTYVGTSSDRIVITPSHFLIGRNSCSKPNETDNPCEISPYDIFERLNINNDFLRKFWTIWNKLYITNLPPIVRGFDKRCRIKVGSIVIVRDDTLPKLHWPVAIVEEIYPGTDGLTRIVRVKTAKGSFTRSVQNLYDLEIMHNIDDCNNDNVTDEPIYDDNDVSNAVNNDAIDNDIHDETIDDINDIPVLTRAGRTVRPPRKLDL